jgi:NAD(P)-dependent dehydrogenase (short-subunit alcohol dehydrogenase family)
LLTTFSLSDLTEVLAQGAGGIVNTASSLGMMAFPNAGDYTAAKHGVIGLTRAAAVEYAGRGIRASCVLPSLVETPESSEIPSGSAPGAMLAELKKRHPAGRFAKPSEIGEATAWLLSDASVYVNGAALPVDGGFLAG